MQKIPTLFERDFDNNGQITDVVRPECEWVTNGLGVPTYKWDGTAVKYHHGVWFVRRTIKNVDADSYHEFMRTSRLDGTGEFPRNFKLEEYDEVTRKAFGWIPATGTVREKYLVRALVNHGTYWLEGTYELIGPKINGNRHHLERHHIKRHGTPVIGVVPVDYEGLADYLEDFRYEGIVWYRSDGSMAKIKRRDFGLG